MNVIKGILFCPVLAVLWMVERWKGLDPESVLWGVCFGLLLSVGVLIGLMEIIRHL